MSGKNTEEYRKMLAVTPELTDLLADGTNIVRLSQELFGGEAKLISKSNNREMANPSVPADVRAAQLVGMVMTKVDLNSQNFYKFVEALKKDEVTYGTILAQLCKGNVEPDGDDSERMSKEDLELTKRLESLKSPGEKTNDEAKMETGGDEGLDVVKKPEALVPAGTP